MRTTFVLSSLLALASCSGGRAGNRTNLAETDKEQQLLQDSARLYWESVRWADTERAGAFIEDAEQRVLYRDWLAEHSESHKLESAEILQVVLGAELDPPVDGRLQNATVHVRTKGYSYPAQIVESERVSQPWYRSVQGWFVDWELPED